VLVQGQFNFERRDLLFGFGKHSRRSADLCDEFVKGGVVHRYPESVAIRRRQKLHSSQKVNQMLPISSLAVYLTCGNNARRSCYVCAYNPVAVFGSGSESFELWAEVGDGMKGEGGVSW
jgi:hypothetical protein